jgi:hypothetical protein
MKNSNQNWPGIELVRFQDLDSQRSNFESWLKDDRERRVAEFKNFQNHIKARQNLFAPLQQGFNLDKLGSEFEKRRVEMLNLICPIIKLDPNVIMPIVWPPADLVRGVPFDWSDPGDDKVGGLAGVSMYGPNTATGEIGAYMSAAALPSGAAAYPMVGICLRSSRTGTLTVGVDAYASGHGYVCAVFGGAASRAELQLCCVACDAETGVIINWWQQGSIIWDLSATVFGESDKNVSSVPYSVQLNAELRPSTIYSIGACVDVKVGAGGGAQAIANIDVYVNRFTFHVS